MKTLRNTKTLLTNNVDFNKTINVIFTMIWSFPKSAQTLYIKFKNVSCPINNVYTEYIKCIKTFVKGFQINTYDKHKFIFNPKIITPNVAQRYSGFKM